MHSDCHKMFDGVKLFPIEVDWEKTTCATNNNQQINVSHSQSIFYIIYYIYFIYIRSNEKWYE